MRGYRSKAARDERLKAALSDAEFGEVVTAQERDPAARLIVKALNVDLTPHGTYSAVQLVR